MMDSEHDLLLDQVASEETPTRFGGPLAMLGLVLAAWITGRVVLWENPFPVPGLIAEAGELFAEAEANTLGPAAVQAHSEPVSAFDPFSRVFGGGEAIPRPPVTGGLRADQGPGPSFASESIRVASGHHALWRAAVTSDMRGVSWRSRQERLEASGARQARVPVFPGNPGSARLPKDGKAASESRRWSAGAWAFFREGSNSAPIVQGRVPVYGASQIGANLQYRAAPGSAHDPRLYLRAYRALIEDPESEIAAGVSAKPLRQLPVRLAAEFRATDNEFRRELRPAFYAITEVPPLPLPLGVTAEVYAGAGYVGGEAKTAFVDGQAAVLREVASFDLRKVDDVRVSFGAGAWGGAQRDASRIDLGPTMRVDVSLGTVPARLSINYRERVGGDAAPESGIAATVSTQF